MRLFLFIFLCHIYIHLALNLDKNIVYFGENF